MCAFCVKRKGALIVSALWQDVLFDEVQQRMNKFMVWVVTLYF